MTEFLDTNRVHKRCSGFPGDALGVSASSGLPWEGTARSACNSRSLSMTRQSGQHNAAVVPGDVVPALFMAGNMDSKVHHALEPWGCPRHLI